MRCCCARRAVWMRNTRCGRQNAVQGACRVSAGSKSGKGYGRSGRKSIGLKKEREYRRRLKSVFQFVGAKMSVVVPEGVTFQREAAAQRQRERVRVDK